MERLESFAMFCQCADTPMKTFSIACCLMALGCDLNSPSKELIAKAENGDIGAQCQLAMMYDQGEGAEKNPAEAFKWYRKAAEQGNEHSQLILGILYDKGAGVERNPIEAAKWYLKSADRGWDVAQVNVGWMYYRGDGVTKDTVEGYKWCLLGAAQGHQQAQKYVAEIERNLPPEQLAEGQRRARAWNPTVARKRPAALLWRGPK